MVLLPSHEAVPATVLHQVLVSCAGVEGSLDVLGLSGVSPKALPTEPWEP